MLNLLTRTWFQNFNWKKGLYTVSTLYVAWTFLAHGVQALMVADKYIPVAEIVLPSGLAPAGLIVIGILDLTVVGLLLLRNHPLVLAYAALYPFVPMTLTYMATNELEMVGKILILVFAVVSYLTMRATQSEELPVASAT